MRKTLALVLCFALSQSALADRARSRAERLVAEGKRYSAAGQNRREDTDHAPASERSGRGRSRVGANGGKTDARTGTDLPRLLAVLAGRKVPDAAGLAKLVSDDLFVEAVLQHAAGKSVFLRDYLKAHSHQRWECAQARRLLKHR